MWLRGSRAYCSLSLTVVISLCRAEWPHFAHTAGVDRSHTISAAGQLSARRRAHHTADRQGDSQRCHRHEYNHQAMHPMRTPHAWPRSGTSYRRIRENSSKECTSQRTPTGHALHRSSRLQFVHGQEIDFRPHRAGVGEFGLILLNNLNRLGAVVVNQFAVTKPFIGRDLVRAMSTASHHGCDLEVVHAPPRRCFSLASASCAIAMHINRVRDSSVPTLSHRSIVS